VLGVVLALCRNLHVALRLQAERRWDRPAVMMGTGTFLRELRGSHVAVLGLGPIGLDVGQGAAALGAVVRGYRRRPSVAPPAFDAVVGPTELQPLLGWADVVVVALPHTKETDRLLGEREFGCMKSTAYLVNVARGGLVDEAALIRALTDGRIAGAALDVFDEEPLPPDSPLWTLPNVIVTPHVAGARPRYLERALDLFIDNLDRFLAGTPLRNVVDPVAGYPLRD
jgi:phosphoglycerate dehydrogenase-like enzyme